MREVTLFTIDTPYRASIPVTGWYFGNPEQKTLAVMGALRGNEIQQMYVCARLIETFRLLEAQGRLAKDCGILVIPCANQFSMNVGKRFWAADNTDINRMFPGYDLGETTQRIAARIFAVLQTYRYGIQMASFYLPGDFLPHVRMMETGYQHVQEALDFGLPYVVLRKPRPYDTTTLNYNWQIWDTQAVSLYTRETDSVDRESALGAVAAVLRYLRARGGLRGMEQEGFIRIDASAAEHPKILYESELKTVLTTRGGLFMRYYGPGESVQPGCVLAEVLDPCTCDVLERLMADDYGTIFFTHKAQLINGHEVAFRLIRE